MRRRLSDLLRCLAEAFFDLKVKEVGAAFWKDNNAWRPSCMEGHKGTRD